MFEIVREQELVVNNVLSYRGIMQQLDIERIGKDMEQYISLAGSKRVANPITATFYVEQDKVDMEILIPIDKKIESRSEYKFKEQIKIVNAVKMSYIGHPSKLPIACEELNKYMSNNGLQPITVGYNVTKKMNILDIDNTEIDVYVGISPNIL